MAKRCGYCGKMLLNELEFCSDKCKAEYKHVVEHDTKNIKYFVCGIVLGSIVSFAGVFLSDDKILGIGIMLLGAVVCVFPFTTPDTAVIFGYKRARVVGRMLGIVLLAVGVWVAFFENGV